jgi:hypothetical protein
MSPARVSLVLTASAGLAAVFQATQLDWPLHSQIIFADGLESGDTIGWNLVSP